MDRLNAEGYLDPTMYCALRRIEVIENYKKLIYVCSPYRGDVVENEKKAMKYCRFVIGCNKAPLAPHLLYPRFLNDSSPLEREIAMQINKILLERCDELWVFGNDITQGMGKEVAYAKKLGIPMKWFKEEMEE
jgi:hypothetical protein